MTEKQPDVDARPETGPESLSEKTIGISLDEYPKRAAAVKAFNESGQGSITFVIAGQPGEIFTLYYDKEERRRYNMVSKTFVIPIDKIYVTMSGQRKDIQAFWNQYK